MLDQAHKLRQMMHRHKRLDSGMRVVAVCGGSAGVGVTTTAAQLATSLARQGHRAILVDADFERPDATRLCGIEAYETLAHVLAGRRTIHEILQPGPAGIQVLPGVTDTTADCSPAAQERLGHELATLGRYADFTIVDAGCAQTQMMRYWWQRADSILLVATPLPATILHAYAAIKTLYEAAGSQTKGKIQTLINRADSAQAADAVYGRIQSTCRRFLDLEIAAAGWLGIDPAVPHLHSSFDSMRGVEMLAGDTVLASQADRLAEFMAKSARTSLANTA